MIKCSSIKISAKALSKRRSIRRPRADCSSPSPSAMRRNCSRSSIPPASLTPPKSVTQLPCKNPGYVWYSATSHLAVAFPRSSSSRNFFFEASNRREGLLSYQQNAGSRFAAKPRPTLPAPDRLPRWVRTDAGRSRGSDSCGPQISRRSDQFAGRYYGGAAPAPPGTLAAPNRTGAHRLGRRAAKLQSTAAPASGGGETKYQIVLETGAIVE